MWGPCRQPGASGAWRPGGLGRHLSRHFTLVVRIISNWQSEFLSIATLIVLSSSSVRRDRRSPSQLTIYTARRKKKLAEQ
jgi:hypothetical protein